jgi:glycosyltransferase involved in cell wall biosynthesis
MNICCIDRPGLEVSKKSGMQPLMAALQAEPFSFVSYTDDVKKRSWLLGTCIQAISNNYYGSAWNQWIPIINEIQLRHKISKYLCCYHILQFCWGEFATPSLFPLFRHNAEKIIGVFHCSQRRQWRVTKKPRWYKSYDHIVLMSDSQRDYFIDNGYPKERMTTILHGVDCDYFAPTGGLENNSKVLNLLLVGSTERDHQFAAEVLRNLDCDAVCKVVTHQCFHHYYDNISCVELMPRVSDEELVQLYQKSDLLFLPMLDCTANNAILESMACGTPVMVNCVGGVPEYVDPMCNLVMIGKKRDEWVDVLQELCVNRDKLSVMRARVRAWAERFDWRIIAKQYLALYDQVLGA